MSMMQIAILGVAGAVLAIQLKQSKPEYAVLFCIGISVLIFFSVYGKLKTILSTLQEVTTIISFDAIRLVLLKIGFYSHKFPIKQKKTPRTARTNH